MKFLEMFLSQTVRARAFIFGMLHHLLALYQNTSNYDPGVEISPMLWVLGFHIEIKEIFLIFLSQTVKARALIFGMWYLLVDLYQVCSYDAHGIKTGPTPGVTSWNMGIKTPIFKKFSTLQLEGVEL